MSSERAESGYVAGSPRAAQAGLPAGGAIRRGVARLPGGAKTFWIALGVLLVLLLMWVLRQTQGTDAQVGHVHFGGPTPVGVAKAATGDMPVIMNALGTVTPLVTVTVRPQVSGPLVKFDFQEGKKVKSGDVLAEIDPRPFQAALDAAKGALDRDRAMLANAVVDVHRYQSLAAAKAIAQQQVATQAALVKQDQGVVKADEGNVETAALNLKYATIRSPVDGRAGIRQVDLGNLVQAGQTNGIVTITQMQPMSVVFSLPEDDIGRIMARLRGGATLTATAYDRTQTHALDTGKLSAVDSQIDPTTGTVKLRAIFNNEDSALFPNQFVNVRLLADTLHGRTIVPSAAIQRGAEGTYVFVVSPDKTVSMRPVTLGASDGTHVVIVKGVKPGATVVVDGADRLRDGAAVSIPKLNGAIAKPSAGPASARSGRRHGRFAALLKQDCAVDMQKFCPKAAPGTPAARACFRGNMANFSGTCRDAFSKLRSRGGQGRAFGSGGG